MNPQEKLRAALGEAAAAKAALEQDKSPIGRLVAAMVDPAMAAKRVESAKFGKGGLSHQIMVDTRAANRNGAISMQVVSLVSRMMSEPVAYLRRDPEFDKKVEAARNLMANMDVTVGATRRARAAQFEQAFGKAGGAAAMKRYEIFLSGLGERGIEKLARRDPATMKAMVQAVFDGESLKPSLFTRLASLVSGKARDSIARREQLPFLLANEAPSDRKTFEGEETSRRFLAQHKGYVDATVDLVEDGVPYGYERPFEIVMAAADRAEREARRIARGEPEPPPRVRRDVRDRRVAPSAASEGIIVSPVPAAASASSAPVSAARQEVMIGGGFADRLAARVAARNTIPEGARVQQGGPGLEGPAHR